MTLEIASVEMMGQTAALLAKLVLFQFVTIIQRSKACDVDLPVWPT